MINFILNGIFNLVINLVNIILTPIDALISTFLPDISSALVAIGNFLELCLQYISWAISLTGLSSNTLNLIVAYFTFKLTVPFMISTVKSALKWYKAIVP